jgi:epoxide hydrolase-like predicted phosphatase
MIKVIIFDLGGVLFTNGTKKFIDTISHKYNVDKEKVREVMDGEIGSLYRESKISRDEFWQRCLEQIQITADIDKLEAEWISGYELIEGTRDLIKELSKKYKVYFLSDNVKERVDKVNQKHNFLEWFEDGVFSHEAGVRKPNPQIYKIALDKARVKPEEAVFIDDKPHFLIPAKEMGMLTFAFETPGKLREDLKNNNLLD